MKHMSPHGQYCDLACYPICPGYKLEGCLMFGEERSFLTMFLQLLAEGIDIRTVKLHPKGMWSKHHTIRMAKDMGKNVYVGEALN